MSQVERVEPIIDQTRFGLNLASAGLKIGRQFFGRVPYDCITHCRIFSKTHLILSGEGDVRNLKTHAK